MKGSQKILTERGKWVAGTLRPDAAKQLNTEPDWGSTKSAIAELYEKEYHFILVGVRQPNARYPTSAPEMGTDADRLRVSRAAGSRPEQGGGPRESRHAGAAALAPLGRCARLGHCGFASYDCVTHKSDTLLDHLLLHFEIRIQISV